MSILLESLSGKKNSEPARQQDLEVPDISVAHYDDELLGDEWLIRKVQFWQRACIFLVVITLFSWGYLGFYMATNDATPVSSQLAQPALQKATVQAESKVNLTATTVPSNGSQTFSSKPQVEVKSNLQSPLKVANEEPSKLSYTPQKQVVSKPQKTSDPATPVKKLAAKPSRNNAADVALSIQALPAELQAQLPDLKVDSFVVADNQKDSFVILDGAFYTVNQVIAPELILREIKAQHLIVEFKSQRVKIPYQ
ncbi:general secretion pathway protein GspB [Aliikangiella sp. IMCC44632]